MVNRQLKDVSLNDLRAGFLPATINDECIIYTHLYYWHIVGMGMKMVHD